MLRLREHVDLHVVYFLVPVAFLVGELSRRLPQAAFWLLFLLALAPQPMILARLIDRVPADKWWYAVANEGLVLGLVVACVLYATLRRMN